MNRLTRFIKKIRKAIYNMANIDILLQQKNDECLHDTLRIHQQNLIRNQYEFLFCSSDKPGVSEQAYGDKKIIVSLTSYGMRINDVHLVIESIMRQTMKANRILLWLSEDEFSLDSIPASLKMQIPRGLEVRFCEDIRSYKKLIPTFALCPNDIIITIDDDAIYPIDLIDRLYKCHKASPSDIICTHSHIIEYGTNGNLKPYVQWRDPDDSIESVSIKYLPVGLGGILYPPKVLHEDVTNKDLFLKLAPTGDDLWFKTMALLNNTKTRQIALSQPFEDYIIPINQERDHALFDVNIYKNDKQLALLFSHFKISKKSFNE